MPTQLEYGEVTALDHQTCRLRVRLDDRDGVQTYWLNIPQRNTQGTQRRRLMPEIGEQVAVLLDGDGVGGVCLGGIYSTAEHHRWWMRTRSLCAIAMGRWWRMTGWRG